jgi:hypothetical protein
MSQTNIQRSDALRYGSVILELGDDFGSLINVGAIRNMNFEHKAENIEVAFDNAPAIKKFKSGKKASFVFDLAEIDLTTFTKSDDGLAVLSAIAGTPTDITNESLTLSGENTKALKNKNGDNTKVGNLVVTDATGATTYTENTDYSVQVGADGFTRIARIAGGTITDGQEVHADYQYTPNVSKKLTFHTGGTKTYKVARITNTNNEGKTFRIDLENVTNIKPLATPFQADDSDDIMVVPMELEGEIVEIIDEQSVA